MVKKSRVKIGGIFLVAALAFVGFWLPVHALLSGEDVQPASVGVSQAAPLNLAHLSEGDQGVRPNQSGVQVSTSKTMTVSADQRGSLAGLWIGDVVVNDVSEGRLGSTNVVSGALSVALRARDETGIDGAVEMQEVDGRVAMTLTLNLNPPKARASELTPVKITGTAPYIGGYVFVDANMNGQRDGDEQGLKDIRVTLTNGGQFTSTTAADGSYLFDGLQTGAYQIVAQTPVTYTSDFSITLPITYTSDFSITLPITTRADNAVPSSVTLDSDGVMDIFPSAYMTQVVPPPYMLPYFDERDNRLEPQVNFGYVTEYNAVLGLGHCDSITETTPSGQAVNGILVTDLPGTNLPELLTDPHAISVTGPDGEIACGDLEVAAPTQSEFRYRVILRVAENGVTELLPYYEPAADAGVGRISAPAFSFTEPIVANTGRFSDTDALLDFSITVGTDDPLNPFKHKYHPDHDNLDGQFEPLDEKLDPYLFEAFAFTRRIRLSLEPDLAAIPSFVDLTSQEAEALEVELDRGGETRGGRYEEVVQGVHKNDITARGYFVIRHVLADDEDGRLYQQEYDRAR